MILEWEKCVMVKFVLEIEGDRKAFHLYLIKKYETLKNYISRGKSKKDLSIYK